MNAEQLAQSLQALLAMAAKGGTHTKAPANFNTAGMLTQPGGIFTVPGIEPELFSTHIQPAGLGAVLPAMPSATDDPRYGLITGFSDDIGSEATNPCDDGPTGYMKAGTLTAQFGRLMRDTETIQIDALLHQQRGSSTNLRVMREMLNPGGMTPGLQTDPTATVIDAQRVSVGVRTERKLATMLWQGSTANNTAGGGYKEFPGLDNQIATGQIDADTGVALPSVDSLIFNFNYNAVDGTVLDIVDYLSAMEFNLRDVARRTNMLPVTWAVVMRPELWFELSAVWPCRYLTNRCATDTGTTNPVIINDNVNVAMRDGMRNGAYIDINGNRYPVITDDGIFEHTNINNGSVTPGSYASSLYFAPLRVIGNFPSIYWEYIDYNNIAGLISSLGAGARNTPFWVHPGGRFLWVYKPNGLCFKLQLLVEPRVVLRTPHLAGKIQSILYTPLNHLRDSQPTSPYFLNGGVSLRSYTGVGSHVWA